MATQIERDAITLLRVLAEAPRGQYVDREEVAQRTDLPPDRINDAASFLVDSGYAEWIQTFGTAPYDFNAVTITSRGRYEHQRIAAAPEKQPRKADSMWHRAADLLESESSTAGPEPSLPPPAPIGSPYGFTDEDWETVSERRGHSSRLYAVLGHQFHSGTARRAGGLMKAPRRGRRALSPGYRGARSRGLFAPAERLHGWCVLAPPAPGGAPSSAGSDPSCCRRVAASVRTATAMAVRGVGHGRTTGRQSLAESTGAAGGLRHRVTPRRHFHLAAWSSLAPHRDEKQGESGTGDLHRCRFYPWVWRGDTRVLASRRRCEREASAARPRRCSSRSPSCRCGSWACSRPRSS